MGAIYTGALDFNPASDGDFLWFELKAGSQKLAIHSIEMYSDFVTDGTVLISLYRAASNATGGTSVTIEPIDPDSPSSSATLAQFAQFVSGGTVTHEWRWTPQGPFIYRPAPEDRLIIDRLTNLQIRQQTVLINEYGGSLCWEEL
jgi:hypothetical protein